MKQLNKPQGQKEDKYNRVTKYYLVNSRDDMEDKSYIIQQDETSYWLLNSPLCNVMVPTSLW